MVSDRLTARAIPRRGSIVAAACAGLAVVLGAALVSSPSAAAGGAPGQNGGNGGGSSGVSGGRAWLGVALGKLADAGQGGGAGVRVQHVVRTSPAALAGISEGEQIIAVGGEPVGEPVDVTRKISRHPAGDTVTVALRKDGAQRVVSVQLARAPSSEELARMDLVGAFAPDWAHAEAIDRAPASMAAIRGKVVLLDFWATWCGPCRVSMPQLGEWQRTFGPRGLVVVGISAEERETVKRFTERTPLAFPLVLDPQGDTSSRYDVAMLPTRVLVDRRGVVRDLEVGFDPGKDAVLQREIEELLNEPSP